MLKPNSPEITEARDKAEMGRKAAAEGMPALAAEFYSQAAARYAAAGWDGPARACRMMAR
jgi:hypothetical protein